jgi:hypothetical protein
MSSPQLLWICLLCLLCTRVTIFVKGYEVVRCCASSVTSTQQKYLLINHFPKMVAREIIDSVTLEFLVADPQKLKTLDSMSDYLVAQPVPKLQRNNWSPDEVVRVELLLLTILQEPLLYDVKYLGPFVNPSIILFRNRLLLATSLQWGESMGCKGPQSDMVEFRWMNHTDFPIAESRYIGIPTNDSSSLVRPLVGQDPRLMYISTNSFMVAFTNHRFHPVRMGFAIIETSPLTGNAIIREDYHLIVSPAAHTHPQKNWTPFYHNRTVYFVQSISPFRVVTLEKDKSVDKILYFDKYWNVLTPTVVAEHSGTVTWNYGEIRGGSNAVLVDVDGHEPCYLSFFHSSKHLTGNSYLTYFMGAYTFSAQQPFKLLAASPYPIVHDDLYQGPWAFITARRIDYVPFPTGLSIQNGIVYLSLGHQDWRGLMVKLNASQLLNSLVPVVTDNLMH